VRLSGRMPVKSPAHITLENNGKIRPQPDRENAFAGVSGGDEVCSPPYSSTPPTSENTIEIGP
jgi:hypothetical protein